MGERCSRKDAGLEVALDRTERVSALARNQGCAEQRRREDEANRLERANPLSHVDQQKDLGDRGHEEEREQRRHQPHGQRITAPVTFASVTLRDLPSVGALTDELRTQPDTAALPGVLLVEISRRAIEAARTTIVDGGVADPFIMAHAEAAHLMALRPRNVINATGVLLHTNLGRAAIATPAAQAAASQLSGYGNLEFDITTGRRGGRGAYVAELLAALVGSEAALVVNNNAAALVLALAALAGDGGAAVSRGELIEIGGSFRLPELMAASGARMVEVGTTNRTRVADYAAVASDVRLFLKVHPSNYRVEGFAEEAAWGDLAALASRHGLPFVADVGSGLLDTRTPWLDGGPPAWLGDEPGVKQTVDLGASVVIFSGDKLLGGPQSGLIVGARDHVAAMAKHPLARALRVDGATQAALATTLELYAAGQGDAIPFWRMAALDYATLETRHATVIAKSGVDAEVVEAASLPGAGSVPGKTIPSPAIRLVGAVDEMWHGLLALDLPVAARRRDDALLIDLRTVDPSDDETVATAIAAIG